MPPDLPFVVPFALVLAALSSALGAFIYRGVRRSADRVGVAVKRRHPELVGPYQPQSYPRIARRAALFGGLVGTVAFAFIEYMVYQQSGRVTFFIPLWVVAIYLMWWGIYRIYTMRVLVTRTEITVFLGHRPEIILTRDNITFVKLDPQYQRHLLIRTNAGQKVRLDTFVFDLGQWESDLNGYALYCAQQGRKR